MHPSLCRSADGPHQAEVIRAHGEIAENPAKLDAEVQSSRSRQPRQLRVRSLKHLSEVYSVLLVILDSSGLSRCFATWSAS